MEQVEIIAARARRGRPFGVRTTVAIVCVLAAAAMAIPASEVGGDQDRRSPRSHAAALAGTPASSVSAPQSAPAGTPATPVTVSIDASQPGSAVPSDFLGLSFEASDLHQIAQYGGRGDLVSLLRSLGPGLLRFGGISADTRIAWSDAATPTPAWAGQVLRAGDLRELRRLAQASGWRVLLTVGLAHYAPRAAAREVAAAHAALGSWLAGIEVGNEPDAYARHRLRRLPWNFARYDAEVRVYRRAIARLVPGVPLAGPGVSGSHVFARWGPSEARSEHPILLTGHHYPLGCRQTPQPSIERLLSPEVRALEGTSLQRYMAVSREFGTPFRMDEANSVSCGGSAGISNTFAAALWATGYIAQTMAAGVSGINFEGNPANCFGYSAVCAPTAARLAAGGLNAQPLWYALLVARNLIGDRPLGDQISSPGQPNLALDTFLTRSGALQFTIVDDEPTGSAPLALSLRVGPHFGAASILSLTAPGPEATTGVTLGGRPVGANGSWSEPASTPSAPAQNGIVQVTVQPSSAALVTVTPAP
jgi:hypothetical protein